MPPELLDRTIDEALEDCRARSILIYTFALYFDHESSAISVCVDTEANSKIVVNAVNAYNNKHFLNAVKQNELSELALWSANPGRNFSLGDFVIDNAGRTDVAVANDDESVFLTMIKAIIRNRSKIIDGSAGEDSLIFCCSGPNDEVEYVWSAIQPAVNKSS